MYLKTNKIKESKQHKKYQIFCYVVDIPIFVDAKSPNNN